MGPNLQFHADMITFTEEILDGKLHFLCSEPVANLGSDITVGYFNQFSQGNGSIVKRILVLLRYLL